MNRQLIITISFVLLLGFGCKTTSKVNTAAIENSKTPIREHSIQALLWQQQAAEYKALCHQAFNLAKLRIDEIVGENKHFKRPLAIITDVDETVLDNSPYNAKMVLTDSNYKRETWIDWGNEIKAKPVPGALAFFNYAAKKGVTIFYLSNRYNVQKEATIKNLIRAGFPNVDSTHVLLRTTTSAKKPRRDSVAYKYQIIMLLGDNLSDFSEEFDKQSTKNRNNLVEKMANDFGNKFIVLPNPMYGDWETKGIYEGSYKWTASQKDSIRKAKLISY